MTKFKTEQILFAENILKIFAPTVEAFGFIRHRVEIESHFTTIIFRKNKQYIKISSSTYPTDYPYCYNVILGEGDSEEFYEWDWNSTALWRLKVKTDPKAKEYDFPHENKIKCSVENANKELQEYGDTFLNGSLTSFYEARSEQNKNREPYKIHLPGKNGYCRTIDDPISIEQKKKYS